LCFLALSPLSAMAQSQLDPVVVTGSREALPLSQNTGDIVVIDSETIRNSTADSVADLLRREAGLQLARNGGPGQNSGFFLRGASTNGTLVLLDGVRIGSATLGQAEFEALNLAQIDHIEVLRGPASSLYGADGVGGVVQIFTKRGAGAPSFVAGAAIGGYSSARSDAGVSGGQGPFDYAVSLQSESSRGVSALREDDGFGDYNPDRDGYSLYSGNLKIGYVLAPGHRIGVSFVQTHLDAQFDSAVFNPPDFTADPSPDFRNHLTTRVASADYRGAITSAWTTTLQLARSVDDLISGARSSTFTRFITDRDQQTWQNALKLGSGQQLVLAYEHLSEGVTGDSFPTPLSRSNNAGVLGYSGQFGPHSLQVDVRQDDNSVYGNNTTGRAGYAFDIVSGLKVRALAGTTFRAPTFNDLYYPGYGVATVQPEHGRSIEAGLSWQSGSSAASVTVYRNQVRNLINFQPDRSLCPADPAYDSGCASNVGRARLQGATISGSRHIGALSMSTTLELLDAKDAESGQRLPRRAAQQESVVADYDMGAWSFGGSLLFVGSRPDSGVELGGYGTVDLHTIWRWRPHWRLEARMLNALDHRVEPVLHYEGLGRQAWIGVRYDGTGI
jgi:vitamin B12 transporter